MNYLLVVQDFICPPRMCRGKRHDGRAAFAPYVDVRVKLASTHLSHVALPQPDCFPSCIGGHGTVP